MLSESQQDTDNREDLEIDPNSWFSELSNSSIPLRENSIFAIIKKLFSNWFEQLPKVYDGICDRHRKLSSVTKWSDDVSCVKGIGRDE